MSSLFDQPSSQSGSDASGLTRQLERKIGRARLVIALNRLWPAVWLPLAVAGVFLLLSLLGVWRLVPHEVHKGMLWGFGAALIISFIPLIRVRWPSRAEALRHLEVIAGLPHRPATSYHDALSETGASSPATKRLWAAHRERMAKLFAGLRSGWPHPRVDMRDPLALRTLLLLLLATAYLANRDEAYDRIKAAFTLKPAMASATARLDAWLTPPVYTGKPPVMLADGARDLIAEKKPGESTVSAPFKSELTVRVNHPEASRFSLRLAPAAGEAEVLPPAFTPGRESTAEFKKALTDGVRIELLEDKAVVAHWDVSIIPDNAPKIALTEPLSEAQRGSLKLRYKVEDDYGVLSAEALVARADDPEDEDKNRPADVMRLGKAPVAPLTLPRANTKEGQGQTYRDLTSHPWAGLPAAVTLEARDQAGQRGRSETSTVTLPERQFSKPLARAVIEQRKLLVDRPDRKELVAKGIDALTIAPELFMQDDTGLYIIMRTAYHRLRNSNDREELEGAADLLWSIAIHIEDGDLSDAERRLRQAQEDLMKALEENASDEEIKRLMEELRTALNQFLESMAKQAMQNPHFDRNSQNRVVTSKDLEKMLKQIEDLARTGSKDAARQMLSELRDILENAQNGRQQAQNGESQEMMNMLDGLSDLIGKQQQLLDETHRAQQQQESGEMGQEGQQGQQSRPGQRGRQGQQRGRQGQQGQQQGQRGQGQQGQQGQGQQGQGGQGQNPFPGLGQRQGDLEKTLRQLMDKLKGMGANPPDQLDGAGQAMGQAGDALGQENGERATEQQTLALDKLRQGAKSMAEQMMNSMGAQGRANANGSRDPLGRPLPTQQHDNGDSVKVPEEADVQRAREILDELRRRLGEATRPPQELEYIDRLIERF